MTTTANLGIGLAMQGNRWRESSVEEALIEMYLAGVSVRRVGDITEALWGTKVSPSTVSELPTSTLRNGATGRSRAANTRMSKWTASTCGATGVVSSRT